LALLPWVADPEVGRQAHGGVATTVCGRSTPSYWYARTLGWMLAAPCARGADGACGRHRAAAGRASGAWAWRPPSGIAAALLFIPLVLMTALGAAV